jgi:nitrite reductase/ring-hydroxylating ferredoxin subunit/DMSO/TMAO reductase YedYZ heme-binding membrane subunit
MSATYRVVGWTPAKIVYDLVLVAGVALYLLAYFRLSHAWRPADLHIDEGSLAIRAYGSCAFLLMTLVLCIGPLARLDRRFLPLLYNRRHAGVIACLVSLAHAWAVMDWYLAFSPVSPWVALFSTDADLGHLKAVPYLPFGLVALLILCVLAATSHDFWLSFLTPPVWKSLHMLIYAAFGLTVAHVAFGALLDARKPALPALVLGGAALVTALHLLAAAAERRRARAMTAAAEGVAGGWIAIGRPERFRDGRGEAVALPDGAVVAVFREGNRLHAVTNRCAHQNGPLAEGRIRDGRIVCPWHGHEFCARDGRAPAPYSDRIATHDLRLAADGSVEVRLAPHPPGTPAAALDLSGAGTP